MDYGTTLIILAGIFALFMAWGVGANDVANAMGTSVGSRALTLRQAVIIAAIFEFLGAYLAGGEVTNTIREGIIDAQWLGDSPDLLVYGMLASLLAAGLWLLVATRAGWPVSTTHAIVGAIVGFATVGLGFESVEWSKVGDIIATWITSPALAGIISYWLFVSVQRLVLNTAEPLKNAKRYVPLYIFLVGFIITLFTLINGLQHTSLQTSTLENYGIAIAAGLISMAIGIFFIQRLRFDPEADKDVHFTNVEKVFGILMMFTAAAMAFAHGSNDVANAVGPLAAIVSIVSSGGQVAQHSAMPVWVLALGGAGIVIGLMTYGYRVIATIGSSITELTPSSGFAATLAAAATVVLASVWGLPISTTQTLVGAVLGVGLARGIAALNMDMIRYILLSWIITLPAAGILAIIFYFILKAIFGG